MHRQVLGAPSAIADVDRVVLASTTAPPRGGGATSPEAATGPSVSLDDSSRTSRTVTVDDCPAGCWLVLGEGFHEQWSASTAAGDLGPPQLVDGGFNGWWIEPSSNPTTVTMRWGAQGPLNVALLLSALAVLACIVLAIADRRTRPAGAHPLADRADATTAVPRGDGADARFDPDNAQTIVPAADSADARAGGDTATTAVPRDDGADVRAGRDTALTVGPRADGSPELETVTSAAAVAQAGSDTRPVSGRAERAANEAPMPFFEPVGRRANLPAVVTAAVAWTVGAALVVSPPWALAGIVGGVLLIVLGRPRLAGYVTLGALAVMAVTVYVVVGDERPFPDAGWPVRFDYLHDLGLFAAVSLAVCAIGRSRATDADDPAPNPAVEAPEGARLVSRRDPKPSAVHRA